MQSGGPREIGASPAATSDGHIATAGDEEAVLTKCVVNRPCGPGGEQCGGCGQPMVYTACKRESEDSKVLECHECHIVIPHHVEGIVKKKGKSGNRRKRR